MPATSWRRVGVSAQGAAHRETGTPCQDAVTSTVSGDWLIAAVCDGAGSAPFAEIGASVGAQSLVAALAAMDSRPNLTISRGDPMMTSWRTAYADAIGTAREAVFNALHDKAPNMGLDERLALGHATLLAVVASPTGGVFAHIGDGLGAAVTPRDTVLSTPANGEYANETYFFTQPDWQQNLRLTAFDAPETLLLFTDGGAALATTPDGHLLRGFVDPLTAYLGRVSTAEGTAALRDTLSHDRATRLTGDDLTVFWASLAASDP